MGEIMNTLDCILVNYGENKTLTFKEFLALKPTKLSEHEQQLQSAMSHLYHLNDCPLRYSNLFRIEVLINH